MICKKYITDVSIFKVGSIQKLREPTVRDKWGESTVSTGPSRLLHIGTLLLTAARCVPAMCAARCMVRASWLVYHSKTFA